MPTTTKTPSSYSAPTYYDDVVKTQQAAYDMSSDWLARTVQYGQDTGKMQAATKGYYDAAADDRKYTAQSQSSSNTFEQQMALFDAQASANKSAAELQNSYNKTTGGQQQVYTEANKTLDYNNQLGLLDKQSSIDLAKLDKTQSFTASEAALDRAAKSSGSQADRELQKYLGELDAQSRVTSSLYSSIGNGANYQYKYW